MLRAAAERRSKRRVRSGRRLPAAGAAGAGGRTRSRPRADRTRARRDAGRRPRRRRASARCVRRPGPSRTSARCSRWSSPALRSSSPLPAWRRRSRARRRRPSRRPGRRSPGTARAAADRGLHARRCPPTPYRTGPAPQVSGDGDGARMLAAALAFERMRDGATGPVRSSWPASPGRRSAAGSGNLLLWVVAVNVLLLADDGASATCGDRARTRAHATGQTVRRAGGEPVAGLRAVASRPARRRAAVARRRRRAVADVGQPAVGDPFAAAFTLGVLTDWATSRRPRGPGPAPALPRIGEGGRQLRQVAARLRLAQGRARGGLAELTTPVDYPQVANPAWAPWRGLWHGRWPRSDVPTRRLRWPMSRSVCCAAGARPPPSGRALRLAGRAPRTRGLADCGRRWSPARATSAALGTGRAQARTRTVRELSHRRGGAAAARPLAAARDCGAALRSFATRWRRWPAGREHGRGRMTSAARLTEPRAAGARPDRGRPGHQRGRPTTVPDAGHGAVPSSSRHREPRHDPPRAPRARAQVALKWSLSRGRPRS